MRQPAPISQPSPCRRLSPNTNTKQRVQGRGIGTHGEILCARPTARLKGAAGEKSAVFALFAAATRVVLDACTVLNDRVVAWVHPPTNSKKNPGLGVLVGRRLANWHVVRCQRSTTNAGQRLSQDSSVLVCQRDSFIPDIYTLVKYHYRPVPY